MATAQSSECLQEALRNCIKLCSGAPFQMVSLSEFLMILHTRMGWTWDDVVSLRSLVVRALTNLKQQDQPDDRVAVKNPYPSNR
jgi:hypothetical protein